jgi:hypothetical protein
MSSNDIRNGIVRILKPSTQTKLSARTVGTGFIVSTQLIVTCTHVVKFAGATPGSKVRCTRLPDEQEFDALVDEQYWRDPEQEDIAFLRVDESFAEDFSLKLGTSAKITDHAFSSYGFPATLSKELQVRGTILGETVDCTRLILRTTDVVEGVSGAPVFDQQTRRVVGMVVARVKPHLEHEKQELRLAKGVEIFRGSATISIPTGKLEDLAYAIPSHVLKSVCPELSLEDVCPYRGLLSFDEAYANFFYGRDRLINKLLDSLRHNPRFLAVVGSSGSGKSSVVQAGLFPRIRHGDIPGWQDIQIIKFRPGNDPKQSLGVALEDMLAETNSNYPTPNAAPSSLETASNFWITLHQQIQSQQTRTIIFADQFEELFALCSAEVQKDFTQELLDLLKSNLAITLILTIRADFYEPLLKSSLGEWLEVGQVNVLEMSEVELRETILKPAQDVGLQLEPGLADLIIRDLETTKNPLPLLEFTLEKLWEIEHINNLLTCKCYGEIGGVTGAIAQWADDTYRLFNKTDQDLARKIFTRLIQYNSYNFSDTPDTKKKLPFTELLNLSTDKTDIQKLVNSLADRRLLVTGISEATGEKSIEIIHEALVQEWKLLQKWIQENRENLIQRQKIETAATEWCDRQKASGYLLQGRQLTEARRFLKQQTNILNISSLTEEFLRRSIRSRRINRLKLWGFSLILPIGLIIPVVTQVLTEIATNIKLVPY